MKFVADAFIVHGAGIMWTLKDGELSIGGFLPGSAAFQAGARWDTRRPHIDTSACADTQTPIL